MSGAPHFFSAGFDAVLDRLITAANELGAREPQMRASDSAERYLSEFARLIEQRAVSRVVLVSDSFAEVFPDDRFLDVLERRLCAEHGFEFYGFVGLLHDQQPNEILTRLTEIARHAVGVIEVSELGIKPLLRGLFTDAGGICQSLSGDSGIGGTREGDVLSGGSGIGGMEHGESLSGGSGSSAAGGDSVSPIDESYLFRDVDLTDLILELTRAYLGKEPS